MRRLLSIFSWFQSLFIGSYISILMNAFFVVTISILLSRKWALFGFFIWYRLLFWIFRIDIDSKRIKRCLVYVTKAMISNISDNRLNVPKNNNWTFEIHWKTRNRNKHAKQITSANAIIKSVSRTISVSSYANSFKYALTLKWFSNAWNGYAIKREGYCFTTICLLSK